MEIVISCIDGIVKLFTNPAMFSLLGLIGLSTVILAIKILID